ncbi:MAG: glycoside hydrolase [Gammaproteobacteria bacterium]|nr:glycoside hydrolase [Gammaproteobacteria bacterium]
MVRFWFVLLCLSGAGFAAQAELLPDQPPFALTLQQARDWSPQAPTASVENVSQVPLARRISAPLAGQQQLDTQAKVLYAPDGMNNFANYLKMQPQFNLYNFTHWSQIDVLNWFAGTADLTVQIPARPWVDTAHKNGVKVIGSVFLGIAQWGGNPDTVEALLEQDNQGRFILADKLIQMADYYGFDGWLINQETDLTAVKDAQNQLVKGKKDPERGRELAKRLLAFMQYLTANAPQGMEIHWYDSMLASGEVRWQNQLNAKNQQFLQAQVPSSDAMFLNYWWDQAMVRSSRQKALELGRSPYDVYTGVDLWPSRDAQRAFSSYQWLDWLFDGHKALSSIALFAPNVNFNFEGETHTPAFSRFRTDPTDVSSFYATESRIFAGDNLNLALVDKSGWKGLGAYLPAKSSLLSLPFSSSFNTGQGKVMMQQGKKTGGAWTDISRQDLLPTWQFAVQGRNTLQLSYDFDQPYQGGSSLAVRGTATKSSLMPLYHSSVVLSANSKIQLISRGQSQGLKLYLQTAEGERFQLPLQPSTDWLSQSESLAALAGRNIVQIGLLTEGAAEALDARLGLLEISL